MQFVHEDDLSLILYYLMKNNIKGIFNIAGDGTIRLSEIIKIANILEIKLPYFLVKLLSALFWKLHIYDAPPSLIPFIMYPWVVDNSTLKSKIPPNFLKYDTISTLQDFLRNRRDGN
jgi:UDP-glucose 4-epimerase